MSASYGCYILKPKYCPQCGKELCSIVGIIHTYGHEAKEFMAISDPHFSHGFDCYCLYCKWSGQIFPDRHSVRKDGI